MKEALVGLAALGAVACAEPLPSCEETANSVEFWREKYADQPIVARWKRQRPTEGENSLSPEISRSPSSTYIAALTYNPDDLSYDKKGVCTTTSCTSIVSVNGEIIVSDDFITIGQWNEEHSEIQTYYNGFHDIGGTGMIVPTVKNRTVKYYADPLCNPDN